MMKHWRQYFAAFLIATTLNGARAAEHLNVCPREKATLEIPKCTEAIERAEYKEHFWSVVDPNHSDMPGRKQNLWHCKGIHCNPYNSLGIFKNRIEIGSVSVLGTPFVKQSLKNDELMFICHVEFTGNNEPPQFFNVNFSSSVNCLTAYDGTDLYLSKTSGEEISSVKDVMWYLIHPNGTQQKIVHCNPTNMCLFENCFGPRCPEYFPRLKMDGIFALVLTSVRQTDRGLMFQRRIEPNVMDGTAAIPKPLLHNVKVQNVLESPSGPNMTSHSTPTENLTASSTARTQLATPTAAANGALTLSLLISMFSFTFALL